MNCQLYNDQHGIHAPFYGEIKGRLEVDFLIQKEHTIFRSRRRAVETSAARLLNRLMATSSRHEKRAIVLSPYNVEVEEQIDYLPLYMVMFL